MKRRRSVVFELIQVILKEEVKFNWKIKNSRDIQLYRLYTRGD